MSRPQRESIPSRRRLETTTTPAFLGHLIMNDDPGIRALARPLLEPAPEEREKVLKRYEAARGREVFDRICAKCHRLDGKGAQVGPDLGSIRNRAPSLLLADILLPSHAIAQNHES
jgi:cytochrome c